RLGHVKTRAVHHVAALLVGLVLVLGLSLLRTTPAADAAAGGEAEGLLASFSVLKLVMLLLLSYIVGGLLTFIAGLIWGRVVGYDTNYFTRRSRYIGARFLDHRIWMMGFASLALVLTVVLFTKIPQQFFPSSDSDFSSVSISMVPGTTLHQTE